MFEDHTPSAAAPRDNDRLAARRTRPSSVQTAYLRCGLNQPGGKLPLFDHQGQRYSQQTIRSCIDRGWVEPWFLNPTKPDWLVCKLTEAGRAALAQARARAQVRGRDNVVALLQVPKARRAV